MPKTTVYAELYCDGFLLTGADWSGVQLSYLLSQLNVGADVNSVQFTASDGYKVVIPIEVALLPQTIIAYQINGQPMPEELRLILPDYNGAAWISQIVSLSTSSDIVAVPAPISVGGMSTSRINQLFGNTTAPANPAPTPSSTHKPTATPAIPTASPSPSPLPSSTEVETTPKQQSVGQQSISFDQWPTAALIAAVLVGVATATLVYNRGKK
jgi:hypothetical protein